MPIEVLVKWLTSYNYILTSIHVEYTITQRKKFKKALTSSILKVLYVKKNIAKIINFK